MATTTARKGNEITVGTSTSVILVPRKDGSITQVFVDTASLGLLSGKTWGITNGYATCQEYADGRNSEKTLIYMHRLLLGLAGGRVPQVDHINRNRLDCTLGNLRVASCSENMRNRATLHNTSTGYRGVVKNHTKWRSHISTGILGVGSLHLGAYETALDAAISYDLAALQYHGEFAVLNFPDKVLDYKSDSFVPPTPRSTHSPRSRSTKLTLTT